MTGRVKREAWTRTERVERESRKRHSNREYTIIRVLSRPYASHIAVFGVCVFIYMVTQQRVY